MRTEKLINNLIDQIKEAQIKLGYADETLRFYYPVSSLNRLLETDFKSAEEMVQQLNNAVLWQNSVLGILAFAVRGERVEVNVPREGAEYVHGNIKAPQFLCELIELFSKNHHCDIADITWLFGRYSEEYCCEKMPENMDFDYVIYFTGEGIDEYYYCIKMEMGHTIYHRFTKEDYEAMFQ